MSTYILVHGAWHGAWCWHKVVPLLEQAGHEVITLDLPGLGDDKTPAADIDLERYTEVVCKRLDLITSPVILVGHSMSGIVISQVAERRPDKISSLVYLSAYLLPDGKTILETAQADSDALLLPNLVFSNDKLTADIKQEVIKKALYADCLEADVAFAKSRLVSQALAPLSNPVHVTEESWGRIPRYYIECTEDQAISIKSQRNMQMRSPCQRVMTMQTSHSPFLSAPEQLVDYLLSCNR